MKQEKCKPKCGPKPNVQAELSDFDFDIGRTFALLTAVLVLPVYLSLSVVTYSMAALI